MATIKDSFGIVAGDCTTIAISDKTENDGYKKCASCKRTMTIKHYVGETPILSCRCKQATAEWCANAKKHKYSYAYRLLVWAGVMQDR